MARGEDEARHKQGRAGRANRFRGARSPRIVLPMIDAIITFSIRHRTAVIIASLILAALGGWAVWDTPVDAIPDLSENQVIVFTEWTGHGPREIEDQVTYPLTLVPARHERRPGRPLVERRRLLDDQRHLRGPRSLLPRRDSGWLSDWRRSTVSCPPA